MPKITFLGAAGTVTGSKYLVEAEGKRLLVDCGLFEGSKELKQRNWDKLTVDPASIDWVLLTHAHIDHTGYLPRLVRNGFRGPIYGNSATHELCTLLLPDSAHLQEEDAKYAMKKGYSQHKPPLPLYTVPEAQTALQQFHEIPSNDPFRISPQFSVLPHDAGHILGATWLELTVTEGGKQTLVVFSGDIGRYDQPILKDPESPTRADFLLCEATYGDREHEAGSVTDALADVVNRTMKRGGALVIPAFAVDRTQLLLYYLHVLCVQKRIPRLPIYVDSPMAINITDMYVRHKADHDLKQQTDLDPLNVHEIHMTRTVEESKKINDVTQPCVIISASGMITGGRVLHHLAHRLPDSRSAVLLVGYQAEGSGGRALQDGAKFLRIHGQEVPVRAEVVNMGQLSAHAGKSELLRWSAGIQTQPKRTFMVHGEPSGLTSLRDAIVSQRGWNVTIPDYLQTFDLV
ncbi:MAG TPA: MBL fold metallo-hydrolase [Candidatus Baltobacteraceae bacterium]|nr:MBL fold metallo-hydrolase [Candidatus Baltobacteraceae bacterium]